MSGADRWRQSRGRSAGVQGRGEGSGRGGKGGGGGLKGRFESGADSRRAALHGNAQPALHPPEVKENQLIDVQIIHLQLNKILIRIENFPITNKVFSVFKESLTPVMSSRMPSCLFAGLPTGGRGQTVACLALRVRRWKARGEVARQDPSGPEDPPRSRSRHWPSRSAGLWTSPAVPPRVHVEATRSARARPGD